MPTETKKSKMQIGIPRAMSYFNYIPFWYGFFEALDIKVILSDKTTKQTMSEGSALVVTETCLPIKIYLGHILNLVNKKGIKNKGNTYGCISWHSCLARLVSAYR